MLYNEKDSDTNEATVQRYVNILSNAGFKAFFGDVNNKEAVISILNVLLPDYRQIVDIDYMPTEYQGPIIDKSKEFQYDFMCRGSDGTAFIVELQKYREADWFKRCVSYASRAYDRQNRKGESYDVPPVYLIGLMTVDVGHPDKEFWKDRYISEYTFREKECHDLIAETIVIIFAELNRFDKSDTECVTERDRMLFVLKNIGRMMSQPAWLQHEVYSRIFEACEIEMFSKEKRKEYESDMYDEKRYNSILNTAREEGREEGLAMGRNEGARQAYIEMAEKLLAKGTTVEEVATLTGMTVKECQEILKRTCESNAN